MIDLGNGVLINPAHVISAEVVTRHYMNGSESELVIKFADGGQTVRRHGYGTDVWALLDKIKAGSRS